MNKYFAYIIFFIYTCLFVPFTLCHAQNAQKKQFTVVIDAGHGGNDPGAIGRRGREKNINLNVALKVGRLIENNCPDTRVVYTRTKDVFVPLHRRAEIANNVQANLFISIHTNSLASKNSSIHGTETYTLGLHRTEENLEVAKKENSVILIEDDYKERYAGFNPNSSESYIIFEFLQDKNMSQSVHFAKLVQKHFKSDALRVDRGVHQAGFLVLRETSMPSVLIELGYINNQTEENFMRSERGASKLAASIYKAFLSYKEGSTVTHTTNTETTTTEKKPVTPQTQSKNAPVFKIQILTSSKILPKNSKEFKGLDAVDYYKENGIYKYTYGESTDYNRILQLKRSKVDKKFKDAFIISFKNGKKININQAIKEFKQNR